MKIKKFKKQKKTKQITNQKLKIFISSFPKCPINPTITNIQSPLPITPIPTPLPLQTPKTPIPTIQLPKATAITVFLRI
jgi:hypothetical protein